MIWQLSHRFDPRALPLANRHYNRQRPDSPQFVPPGSCLVLLAIDGGALWTTSWPIAEYVRHAWPGAWVNSLFRRETTPVLASELIRQAIAATRWYYGEPPTLGMITFIDAGQVRRKRDVGRCYRKAGFKHVGFTKGGLWAFQLEPQDMPEAEVPLGVTRHLFDGMERVA